MTFTDFQRIFQVKSHFSSPTSNSMTFQGKLEIQWLFQACMNHVYKHKNKVSQIETEAERR